MEEINPAKLNILLKTAEAALQEVKAAIEPILQRNAELEMELKHGNELPPILSNKFIANYMGVSLGTVSEWLITGELKGTKKGGRWFVLREDFMAWLSDEPTTKLKLAKAR